jgi:hypothetical protein
MLYQQTPYRDQSVGTIADLMLRSNQLRSDQQARLAAIAANLQTQQAQAAAGATLGRGQAWASGFGNLANLAGLYAQAKAPTPAPQPTPQPAPPMGASGGGGAGASWASAPRASMTMTPADPAGALYGAWRVR